MATRAHTNNAGQTSTRERVRQLYFDQHLTVREISRLLGTSTQNIYLHLKALRSDGSV